MTEKSLTAAQHVAVELSDVSRFPLATQDQRLADRAVDTLVGMGWIPMPEIVMQMRDIARVQGWALAVHGTMQRDFDLIAVPWVEDAQPWLTLYDHWLVRLPLKDTEGFPARQLPPRRPHHRRSLLILQSTSQRVEDGNPKGTWDPPCIDVSFMPRAQDIAALNQETKP